MSTFVLTPFRDNGLLNRPKITYNSVHAYVRSCIERALGILKKKFQRLYLELNCTEEIPIIILACCVLQNLVIEKETEELDYFNDIDLELANMSGIEKRNYICNFIVNNQ